MTAKSTTKTADSLGIVKQKSAVIAPTMVPGNVTRHFVRTMSGSCLSSPESPYVNHQQAIRNYLNQTVPLSATQQHFHTRERVHCQGGRGNLCNRYNTVADVTILDGTRVRNVVRTCTGNANRSQQRQSVDVGCDVIQRKSTACDKSKYLDSRNQSHGVIAASVYKDLCNGTIGW